MKHLFIVNPVAGGKDRREYVAERARRALEGSEDAYEIYVTTAPMDACAKIAAEAASGEELRVYACGGDGTLNECVNGAAGRSNVAVTHFPCGTGNDFIKMFGEEKARFSDLADLVRGEVRPFDIIECCGRYALNICSVGIDARIGTEVHQYHDSYIFSAVANLFKGIAQPLTVRGCGMEYSRNACLYVAGALVIIFAHVGELPAVIGMIFKDAFTGHAAVGGFAGATIMAAIRWGAARGVYSNEAGVGSTIAGHCTADTDHPIRQAQFGIFEVFMDTIVICTITSLTVLCSGVWTQEGLSSGQLALAAFQSVFGNFGAIFVAITVFMFVFSTIISAGFFGQIQAEILFGRKFSKVWVYIYPLFICIACAFSNVTTMYMILDGFLAVVVILNMIGLVFMCKQVKDLQTEYYNTPGMYYLADRAAKEAKKAAK